ncbi:RteC domain-containing protein [Sphingobacterium sp. ML3W]|uniref:RteC domain-containing protein n=1 Tax=Sphingobacterium sp. ML3W TaxID=1538644 RepID=UPI00249A5120|nr:RteC domain-containing protein [Sphingobacterium sp. ML3W]WFA81389.1 RteC domain-containing protein [Sphingobacterium sp. ML3W]
MSPQEIDNRYSEMLEKLDAINGSIRESLLNLNASLLLIRETVYSLKEYIHTHPFLNNEEEITFFKYTKPRFAAWQIYCLELHNILSTIPIGTDEMIKGYYINEIGILERFFKMHSFYYQYYLKDEDAKDKLFFLRSNRSLFPPGGELLSTDPDFSTELDYLFSKFRAYEMLRDFMIRRVKLLFQEANYNFMNGLAHKRKRWWSGDKVELVEIAYGIYYTNRLNGGKAEISDIVGWLEESLNIDLSQAYRMFVDIRRRKTISFTKFLDEMRDAIHTNIDESLKHKSKSDR